MRLKLALLIALISTSAAAQTAKIDALMKPWTKTATPGCAVAVVKNGKIAHAKGYGMADLERGVAITPRTVFDIGSTSKQLTAAIIHLLARDKKLTLDDDIRKHLPELPQLAKAPVTIRHLLHHTGGLRDYESILLARGKRYADVTTAKETVAALARQRGYEFEPGAKHEYSNTGYFLLAQIAERVSGKSLREQVKERIYKPLGMTSSEVFDTHDRIVPGRALAYEPASSGWRLELSQWEQTGDGSVLTSVLDLAKWDQNFYAPKVGDAAFLEAMHARGKTADGKDLDYASGLMHGKHRGAEIVMHGGGWAGYRAELVRFPKLKTSVIVLCNAASSDPPELALEIADIVLDKQLGPKKSEKPSAEQPVQLTTGELDRWAVRYREKASGEVIAVRRDNDKLVVEAGDTTMPLVPLAKERFRLGPSPYTFAFTGSAPNRSIAMRGPGHEENYVELAPYKPAPSELSALAGRYWSPELEVLWTIRMEKGVPVLDLAHEKGVKLELVGKDHAIGGGYALFLVRGGFTTTIRSLKGIKFDRF